MKSMQKKTLNVVFISNINILTNRIKDYDQSDDQSRSDPHFF